MWIPLFVCISFWTFLPAIPYLNCSGVHFCCGQKFRTSFRSSFSGILVFPLFLVLGGHNPNSGFSFFSALSAFSAFSGDRGSKSGIPLFPLLVDPNPEFRGLGSGHVWCGHVWRAPKPFERK